MFFILFMIIWLMLGVDEQVVYMFLQFCLYLFFKIVFIVFINEYIVFIVGIM